MNDQKANRRAGGSFLPLAALILSLAMCSFVLAGCSSETDSLNSVINSGQLVFGIAPDMEPFSFVLSEYSVDEYVPPEEQPESPEPAGVSASDTASASDISPADISSGDASPTDGTVSRTEVAAVLQTNDTIAEYTGLSIDLASELTAMLNVKPVFVPIEQDRAVEALDNDEIDCYLCLAAVDIKTASTMHTIDTGMDLRHILVVSDTSDITKLSHLSGKKLGCLSGSDTAKELSAASLISSEVSQIIYYNDAGAMLRAVETGDLDAAVINEPLFNYRRRDGFEHLRSTGEVLAESDLVIAMKLRDDTLSERIELLYGLMTDDGSMDALREKWVDPKDGPSE